MDEELKKAAEEHSKTVFHKPFSEDPQEEHIVYDSDKYDAFIAGAEWMAKQGEIYNIGVELALNGERMLPELRLTGDYDENEEVIVQIRKK